MRVFSRRALGTAFALTGLVLTAAMSTSAGARASTSCSGVAVSSADAGSLPAIVSSQPAGTTFCLGPGIYSLTATIKPLAGDILIGSGSGAGGTELRGDTALSGWSPAGGLFVHTGGDSLPPLGGRCAGGGKICQYPDDVFWNGAFLRRVLSPCSASNVVTGTYCIDYASKTVYLHDDPSGAMVTQAVVPAAISGADGVQLSDMAITHFATGAHAAAAVTVESSSVADDLVVAYNHAAGIKMLGTNPTVENSHLYENGQEGATSWTSSGDVFYNNEVDHNNVLNFDASWDAGGAKFANTKNLTIQDNQFHDNSGNGLWLDNNETGVTISGNVSQNNTSLDGGGDGMRIEISCNATITGNSLISNARNGVSISDSNNITFGVAGSGNTVSGNVGSPVWVIGTARSAPASPCHPGGGMYPETNDVASYNTIQVPAGIHVGFSIKTGVPTSGSKFVANTYTSASGCSARDWKPLTAGNKATAFSSWQTTGQDPAPGGACS